MVVGFVSFLLSLVRAAWLGWLAGLVVLLAARNRRLLLHMTVALAAVAAIAVGLATNPPFAEVLTPRMDTFTNIKKDESVQNRAKLYTDMLALVLTSPFGTGLTPKQELKGYVLDSGVILLLLDLGWFGAAVYTCAIFIALRLIWPSYEVMRQPTLCYRAVVIGLLVQSVGGNALSGLNGFLFWLCLGILLNPWASLTSKH